MSLRLYFVSNIFRFPQAAVCLALAICLPSVAAQGAPPDSNAKLMQLLQQGSEAMHGGKPADAESYFKQAVTLSPESADANLGLGLAELREGAVDKAVDSLGKAVALNPSMPGAHMFLGIADYQISRLDDAVTALRKEIVLQPRNGEALTWLGIVEIGSGHPDEAAPALDQAATLLPKDANVLYYRARAHTLVAEESLQALYRLDPDSWLVHRALAESYSSGRQPEKAIEEFQSAIAKQPGNSDLYEALGDEDQRVSRFDDAIKAYEQEVKLSPHNAIALYNLGKIQVERGDPQAGVAMLRQAVSAHSSVAPSAFYLGLGLAKLGRDEEAATWLEKALASQPSAFIKQSSYYELARVYQKLGRKDDSERALGELKKLKADSSPAAAAPATN